MYIFSETNQLTIVGKLLKNVSSAKLGVLPKRQEFSISVLVILSFLSTQAYIFLWLLILQKTNAMSYTNLQSPVFVLMSVAIIY